MSLIILLRQTSLTRQCVMTVTHILECLKMCTFVNDVL